MCFRSLTVALTKMGINLLLAATIAPVNFGIPILVILFTLLRDIRMRYIVWALMFPMAIEYVPGLLIKLLRFGILLQANYYQLILGIQEKLLLYRSIPMDYW